MIQGISSALSALRMLGEKVSTTANNVANAGTTGFKKSAVSASTVAPATVSGYQMGRGVAMENISEVFSQGDVVTSDSSTDMAVNGKGFFILRDPGGETHYTRDGAFSFDQGGNLADSQGNVLQGWTIDPATGSAAGALGDISLARTSAVTEHGSLSSTSVSTEGVVTGTFSDGTTTDIFQVALAGFQDPAGLREVGNNLYAATQASGAALTDAPGSGGLGSILPQSLEGSNVDIVAELTTMKLSQRSFEANLKVLETANEMTGDVINIKS